MSDKIVIFGAGKIGARALDYLSENGRNVCAFIDNNKKGGQDGYKGLPVIDLDMYREQYNGVDICIACKSEYAIQIKQQLEDAGITSYFVYNSDMGFPWGRLISYAMPDQGEDVILYHVLHDIEDIFYIDVGCNDPFVGSVTKLLYDNKNAHGINIDPQKNLIDIVRKERPRDINLCVGVGAKSGRQKFYYQGALSTFVKGNASVSLREEDIEIVTLTDICDNKLLAGQLIHVLKIDVEGYERQVIEGIDFSKYRPWVLCIESTLPNTSIPVFEEWEELILQAGYKFMMMQGVNRYYLAEEHSELENRFMPLELLKTKYKVYNAYCELA